MFFHIEIKSNAIAKCNETCTSTSVDQHQNAYLSRCIYVYNDLHLWSMQLISLIILKHTRLLRFTSMIDCDSFDFVSAIKQFLSSCNMFISSTSNEDSKLEKSLDMRANQRSKKQIVLMFEENFEKWQHMQYSLSTHNWTRSCTQYDQVFYFITDRCTMSIEPRATDDYVIYYWIIESRTTDDSVLFTVETESRTTDDYIIYV